MNALIKVRKLIFAHNGLNWHSVICYPYGPIHLSGKVWGFWVDWKYDISKSGLKISSFISIIYYIKSAAYSTRVWSEFAQNIRVFLEYPYTVTYHPWSRELTKNLLFENSGPSTKYYIIVFEQALFYLSRWQHIIICVQRSHSIFLLLFLLLQNFAIFNVL